MPKKIIKNIYFSKKKGISIVDCSKNSISEAVIKILKGRNVDEVVREQKKNDKMESTLTSWIGTDESGKGDFFGPLVIAGFFITKEIEDEIIKIVYA